MKQLRRNILTDSTKVIVEDKQYFNTFSALKYPLNYKET